MNKKYVLIFGAVVVVLLMISGATAVNVTQTSKIETDTKTYLVSPSSGKIEGVAGYNVICSGFPFIPILFGLGGAGWIGIGLFVRWTIYSDNTYCTITLNGNSLPTSHKGFAFLPFGSWSVNGDLRGHAISLNFFSPLIFIS